MTTRPLHFCGRDSYPCNRSAFGCMKQKTNDSVLRRVSPTPPPPPNLKYLGSWNQLVALTRASTIRGGKKGMPPAGVCCVLLSRLCLVTNCKEGGEGLSAGGRNGSNKCRRRLLRNVLVASDRNRFILGQAKKEISWLRSPKGRKARVQLGLKDCEGCSSELQGSTLPFRADWLVYLTAFLLQSTRTQLPAAPGITRHRPSREQPLSPGPH